MSWERPSFSSGLIMADDDDDKRDIKIYGHRYKNWLIQLSIELNLFA